MLHDRILPAVGNEITTSLLSWRDVTEEADDTTPVWSVGINTTEEPGLPSQPASQPFLRRVYQYRFYIEGICCHIFSIIGIIGNILSIIGNILSIIGNILSIIGNILSIIGNILSIIVLYPRDHDMWSSTSVFLIELASFDIMLLLTSFLGSIDLLLIYRPYKILYNLHFLQPVFLILYSVSNIAHTGSIYSVVSVNVERYIAICHPLKAASYCTIGKAKKVPLLVVAVCVLYNIPRYTEVYCVWKWEPELNRTILSMNYSDMGHSKVYMSVYLVYVNAVVRFIIPAVSLLTINTSMVRKLYHTKHGLNKQERKGTEKERFTAIALAIAVVFMISLSAAFLELLMYEVNSAVTLDECSELCGYISGASQLAVVINSAINFILLWTQIQKSIRDKIHVMLQAMGELL